VLREPDAELNALSHQVIGAAIEVHRELGPGYIEAVYQAALAHEFTLRGIPFEPQKRLPVAYKGKLLHQGRVDFRVGGRLLVELKAQKSVPDIDRAIVISYLRSAGEPLALLINFHVQVLKDGIERLVYS
jgi:GxxExxY protein